MYVCMRMYLHLRACVYACACVDVASVYRLSMEGKGLACLFAIRKEQRDLSRVHATIVGEELPGPGEAVRDRSAAPRLHRVDSRADLGRVVRPLHPSRRIRCEGNHSKSRCVLSEKVFAHLWLG